MSAIEKPTPIEKDNPSASDLRIRAMQLLLDIPDEGLEHLIRHLETIIDLYGVSESNSTAESQSERGTLAGLARLAEKANISFEPSDLSERFNEYKQAGFPDKLDE